MSKNTPTVRDGERQVNFRCPEGLYRKLRALGEERTPRQKAGQMIQEAIAEKVAREERKR